MIIYPPTVAQPRGWRRGAGWGFTMGKPGEKHLNLQLLPENHGFSQGILYGFYMDLYGFYMDSDACFAP